MPANIRLIRAEDFIVSAPEGSFDLEQSVELLRQVAQASSFPRDVEIIMDLRTAELRVRLADLDALVDVLVANRYSFRNKIALLIDNDPVDVRAGSAFELRAQAKGFNVDCFADFEAAMSWMYPGESV